ncbi:MAG: hypothetical protein EDX89_17010 [Acidobacteria bacterium]|nr:MAG: hypothetical protein EDX89_17010 [Acidobacteriota bacterium]
MDPDGNEPGGSGRQDEVGHLADVSRLAGNRRPVRNVLVGREQTVALERSPAGPEGARVVEVPEDAVPRQDRAERPVAERERVRVGQDDRQPAVAGSEEEPDRDVDAGPEPRPRLREKPSGPAPDLEDPVPAARQAELRRVDPLEPGDGPRVRAEALVEPVRRLVVRPRHLCERREGVAGSGHATTPACSSRSQGGSSGDQAIR